MVVIQKSLDYRMKRLIVEINSTDRSNLIDFNSLQVRDNLYSKADNCYFTYRKFGSRTYIPAGGDEVGVWDRGTKIFGGKIINVEVLVEGKITTYKVECKDWVDQLDGQLVPETYESKTVNEIITDIQSKYATTFDISNVNCTTTIEAIYFDLKPVSKCLDELADRTGYHWYVDSDKKIYFFVEGSITPPFDITDDNGHCISDSLQIEDNYERIQNRVNIQGTKVSTVQVNDATSIAAYGEHEVIIRDDTLTSTAEATQKANAILAAYKDPIKSGSFQTYDTGLFSGQKINVNSTLRGVNQDFIIQSVSFVARTPTDFIYEVSIMTQQDKGLIDLLQQEIMTPLPDAATSFGNQNFTCDVKFSIVNYHKISWTAGTITMSNGDTYSIALGDYTFTNTEICYFDPNVSTTVLQFSTTFGDGVGEDKTALGYAIPNPNVALGAQFIPKGFMGGVRFWGGENIVARTIIADQIGLHALTSDLVTTGEFITLSAQIKDAIITNAKITGTLTIGHTDAKCTDPDADQTSANPQTISWLSDSSSFGNMAWEDLVGLAKLDTTVIVGGYVKTSLLTADNIVTGTLTGLTVQTATSGKRLRMQGSPANEYQFLDSATKVGHLKIDDDGSGGYFAQIYIDYLGPVIEVGSVTGASPSVYFNAPFFESYGRSAIGQVSLLGSNTQVGLGWSGGATATWSFDLGTDLAKVSSNIVPSGTYDLGTSGDEWNKLWVDEINLNGTSKTAWPAAGVTAHGDLTGVTSSQHHVKYSDANARSAIINYNLSGDLQLNAHDLETVKYLKFHASYGKIYVGSTEIINFYSTTKVQFKKPVELGGENLTETGTILPEGTASKNLGGSSNNWEDLYLEGDVYSNGSTQIIALDNDTTAIQVLNRDFIPSSDDAVTCGRYNQRWSDTRTVKFNGSDYGFENDWYLTEHDRVGIKEVGIAVLDSDDELKLFIGESGLYVKGGNVKNLDILPYVKTTIEQRVRMDNHPELRNRTKDKVILGLPDPKDAKIGGGKYIENKITMKKNKEIKSNKK